MSSYLYTYDAANGLGVTQVADGTIAGDGQYVSAGAPATEAVLEAQLPAYGAAQAYARGLLAGIQIVSTSTSALDGTYAIDAAAQAAIDGIYEGIKEGAGLPGGGDTFNYPDMGGTMHAFTATTFPGFAQAVRDYVYALSQGQTPTQPVTIP